MYTPAEILKNYIAVEIQLLASCQLTFPLQHFSCLVPFAPARAQAPKVVKVSTTRAGTWVASGQPKR